MNEHSPTSSPQRPKAVALIAIINGVAFILTLVFWLSVILKKLVPPPNDLTVLSERANAATTYGFAHRRSLMVCTTFASLVRGALASALLGDGLPHK